MSVTTTSSEHSMNSQERKAVLSLASIFSVRLLGLFMIMPVFSLFAATLAGATPTLVGIALGIYGLTQACLQIPFGFISDRIGRKPIITIGLLLLAVGSVISAVSTSIIGVIIGRALQGASAIGGTVMALLADLTRPTQRTKAMAILGIIIGTSFALSLVLGSAIGQWIGTRGIFWVTALLGIAGIAIIHTVVPNVQTTASAQMHIDIHQLRRFIIEPALAKLYLGVLILHALLASLFIALPTILSQTHHLAAQSQTTFYLGVLTCSFVIALPLLFYAERRGAAHIILPIAIALLGLSQLGLWACQATFTSFSFVVFLFFAAFAILEALQPSLVSRIAKVYKGTAMSIYSTAQFLGIFIGAGLGGYLYGVNPNALFMVNAGLCGLWLTLTMCLKTNDMHAKD